MKQPVDHIPIGSKFNKWLVLAEVEERVGPNRERQFRVRCECGTETIVPRSALILGKSQQCKACGNRRHGFASNGRPHPAYRAYVGVKSKCNNPNNPSYGAKGIKVCQRWQTFEAFWADMGSDWMPGSKLKRMDTDRDFTPENTFWFPKKEKKQRRRRHAAVAVVVREARV